MQFVRIEQIMLLSVKICDNLSAMLSCQCCLHSQRRISELLPDALHRSNIAEFVNTSRSRQRRRPLTRPRQQRLRWRFVCIFPTSITHANQHGTEMSACAWLDDNPPNDTGGSQMRVCKMRSLNRKMYSHVSRFSECECAYLHISPPFAFIHCTAVCVCV